MVTENVSKLLDEVKKLSIEEQSSLLLETIKKFTLLDVKNLTDAFCQTFGVTANAPVAIGSGPAVQAAEEKKDEPTEFEVILKDAGDKKVQVIKAVRAITNLGLKEAKALVETAPQSVKGGISKVEAEKIKKELEESGGVVEIKGT